MKCLLLRHGGKRLWIFLGIALCVVLVSVLVITDTLPVFGLFNSYHSTFDHQVPLVVKERMGTPRSDVVVSNGIPLPMGQVFMASDLQLLDSSTGSKVPAGFYPLQKWQDGSWRFVLLSFLTDLPANSQAEYSLVPGDGRKQSSSLRVKDDEDTITVTTGPLKFIVNKEKFNGIDQAWLDETGKGSFKDENQIIKSHDQGVIAMIDGIPYTSYNGEVLSAEVERQDSVAVSIKVTGKLGNGTDKKLNYAVWIQAWGGSQEVQVTLNIAKDEGNEWSDYYSLNEISFNLPLQSSGDIEYMFGGKESNHQGTVEKEAAIYQKESDQYIFINDGTTLESIQSGKSDKSLNLGWADITSNGKGIGVVRKWFWQNFPSAIVINEDGVLSTQVWAKYHEPLKLYTGVSKTTEIRYYFHGDDESPEQVGNRLKAFQLITVAQAPTSWYCQDTKAVDPRLIDLNLSNYPEQDHMLINMYIKNFEEGYNRLLVRRDDSTYYAKGEDGYGFMNFGDGLTPSGGYTTFDTSKNPSPEYTWWANNYYDHPHCFMLQFFRTGELKYLDYALEHVYHLMDIDTASYDPQFHSPGNYKTGPGVMHIKDYSKEYYKENGERDWRFGGQPGHWHFQSVESLFEAYYMAGISQALITGLEAADFAVKVPTLNFTSETRSVGHTLEGLAAAYRHTWDSRYLERMNWVWNCIIQHAETDYTGVNPNFPFKSEYSPYIYVQNGPWQNAIVISGIYKYRSFSPYVEGEKGIDIIARNTLEWDIWGRQTNDNNSGWSEEKQQWSGGADVMTTAAAWLDPLFPEKGFLPILKRGMINNLGSSFHLDHLKAFSHTFKYQWLTQYEIAKEEVKGQLHAYFTAYPTTVAVGEEVTFNNQSLNAVTCRWDFGDGTTSDSRNINVTHTYTKPGTYDINLEISDKNGEKKTLLIKDYIVVR